MGQAIELQDIEEMRRQEGIDDIELRLGIRTLKVGDSVKVTVLKGKDSFETVAVRITSIRGSAFRGKMTKRSRRPGGIPLVFTTSHIHSIPKQEADHDA